MNAPERCPKCGCFEILPTSKRPHRDFACQTTIWSDDGAVAVQGMECMRSQRDAWKAYAERLERAIQATKEQGNKQANCDPKLTDDMIASVLAKFPKRESDETLKNLIDASRQRISIALTKAAQSGQQIGAPCAGRSIALTEEMQVPDNKRVAWNNPDGKGGQEGGQSRCI